MDSSLGLNAGNSEEDKNEDIKQSESQVNGFSPNETNVSSQNDVLNANNNANFDQGLELEDEDLEESDEELDKDPYSFSDGEENHNMSYPKESPAPGTEQSSSLAQQNNDRPDSRSSSGDDEDRLVINEDENRDSNLTLKENVLNLKSDKPRKKHLRFNGMPEEEVAKKLLPDLMHHSLDILIIGINPGLYAAFKGHHYAGPGNHFWKCMFLGGLSPKSMCADDDYKLLDHGIGFTNVVMRASRGNANLTRKEIEDGSQALIDKIKKFKPRIACFNGKGIYEVFSGKKESHFGKQPDKIEGTETHVWVMPNSSARCAQLPRAVDKVPFYAALKKFRDYLKGEIAELDETEVVFTDIKLKSFHEGSSPKFARMNSEFKVLDHNSEDSNDLSIDVRIDPITGKKRRGRPPKPLADGTLPPPKRRVALDENGRPIPRGSNPIDPATGRKKRGRPKKADMLAAQAAFEAEHGCNSLEKKSPATSEFPEDTKVVEAVRPPQPPQACRPLPPFSPNFGRVGLDLDQELKEAELEQGCDPTEGPQTNPRLLEAAQPEQAAVAYPASNFAASAQATAVASNNFSPSFNYTNGSAAASPHFKGHHSPSTATVRPPGTTSDSDLTTKSITGLESLVDQIPAVAENDSGIFSGQSGAGSHPNTPRSVGPYSPAASGFHTSPFHTPHFPVPSTGAEMVSNSASAVSAASAAAASESTSFQHHTDFSVNSLVQQDSGPQPPPASDSFSVSSLTSSYAEAASKYVNNPYTSSFLGSTHHQAFFGGQTPNSFNPQTAAGVMPNMAAANMAYYGQYSNYANTAQAAQAAFAASQAGNPYSAYMPNPGYPYSHYGQYSQSPYF